MTLTWASETRKLSELVDWERNPRNIKAADAARLERSLAEFGQIQTIAVEPDGTLVDGHQRTHVWAAAQRFGPDYEVAVRVASRKLEERERQAIIAALHGGAAGSWDWDALASFDFGTLAEWGFDTGLLATWNDDAANLALMLEAETQEAPEFPEYDESVADEVEMLECPECGHRFPK